MGRTRGFLMMTTAKRHNWVSRNNRSGLSRRLAAFAGLGLVLSVVSACTTVEGTNAFVDVGTFEREVMSETLRGLGVLEREEKPEISSPRARLVMPSQNTNLPVPTESNMSALPEDSDTVQIDMSSLTEEDLRRLRNARVVDLRSLSGRPLTEEETRQLTARMTGATVARDGRRPLYLPPDRYFTTVNSVDLVCLAPNGDLVPLDDPACPPEIRAALQPG